jgi:lysozyme family protein
MKQNFDRSLSRVLASEGGYSNIASDHGGETNLGVTKQAWAEYLGRDIQAGEMAALTRDVVQPFYKTQYWDKCRCDDLPAGLDYLVFDFAVNAGPVRSIKFLQQSLGVVVDGVMGPGTLAAATKADPKRAIEQFSETKERFYKGLVDRDPSQQKFIHGWLARVDSVQQIADAMLA